MRQTVVTRLGIRTAVDRWAVAHGLVRSLEAVLQANSYLDRALPARRSPQARVQAAREAQRAAAALDALGDRLDQESTRLTIEAAIAYRWRQDRRAR